MCFSYEARPHEIVIFLQSLVRQPLDFSTAMFAMLGDREAQPRSLKLSQSCHVHSQSACQLTSHHTAFANHPASQSHTDALILLTKYPARVWHQGQPASAVSPPSQLPAGCRPNRTQHRTLSCFLTAQTAGCLFNNPHVD